MEPAIGRLSPLGGTLLHASPAIMELGKQKMASATDLGAAHGQKDQDAHNATREKDGSSSKIESNFKIPQTGTFDSRHLDAHIPAKQATYDFDLKSTQAALFVSPPPTFTPAGIPMPAAPHTAGTPVDTCDPLASPLRPAAARTTPFASPLPPPSAGKQELNDAAMALTWLAEALTGPQQHQQQSPLLPSSAHRPTTTAVAARLRAAEPSEARLRGRKAPPASTTTPFSAVQAPPPSTNQRSRRVKSSRYTTVIQETILNERLLSYTPTLARQAPGTGATPRTGTRRPAGASSTSTARKTQTSANAATAAAPATAAQGKLYGRGYSENSRVGRAMLAILQYVETHQPEYKGKTPFGGVPERVLRENFGNNPDTSKALRFLVTEKRIVRKGVGGRKDPFHYVMSGGGGGGSSNTNNDNNDNNDNDTSASPDGRAPSPGLSEAENVCDQLQDHPTTTTNNNSMQHVLTPGAGNAVLAVDSAAAAAALTAPSTGKWPIATHSTSPHRTYRPATGARSRKPLQPRLSLDITDLEALKAGRVAAQEALAQHRTGSGGVVGVKRAAPTSLVTPRAGTASHLAPAKRTTITSPPPPPSAAPPTASLESPVTGFMASVVAGSREKEEDIRGIVAIKGDNEALMKSIGEKMGQQQMPAPFFTSPALPAINRNAIVDSTKQFTTTIAAAAAAAPTPVTGGAVDWKTSWPSQLPSTQRLSSSHTLASPPPLTTATAITTPLPPSRMTTNMIGPAAPVFFVQNSNLQLQQQQQQQRAAAQAYLLQMIWRQQAMRAQGAAPASAAASIPAMAGNTVTTTTGNGTTGNGTAGQQTNGPAPIGGGGGLPAPVQRG